MAVTAKMVKELREMTGAGMMDCKKALNETDGDMDAAIEFLRKNGEAKAVKKAGRIARQQSLKLTQKQTSLLRMLNSRDSLKLLLIRQSLLNQQIWKDSWLRLGTKMLLRQFRMH